MAKKIKPVQTFQMCQCITETVEEKLERLKDEKDQEYIDFSTKDLEEADLYVPVDTIQFDYPYMEADHQIFLDIPVTTKRQLINACIEKMPVYFKEHPYSAPHDIDDFVIEIINIYSSGIAFISIGS